MADISVYPRTDANDATAQVAAGTTWQDGDKAYRYVLVEDANLVANDVVELSDVTGTEVTRDRAGGSSLGRGAVAGVALAGVTDAQYGVIQTAGVATLSVPAGDGLFSAGDLIAPHASSDGAVVAATTSTFRYAFAVALATDTATTSAAGTVTAKIFRAL